MTRAAMQKALINAAAKLGTTGGDAAVLDIIGAVSKALKPPSARRKPKKSED